MDQWNLRNFLDKYKKITWQRITLGAVVVLILSLAVQASLPELKSGYWPSYTLDLADDNQAPPRALKLRVLAPVVAGPWNAEAPGYPVSVWLWNSEPLVPPLPTTYTVAFSAASPLLFLTDQAGTPVSEVELVPGNQRGRPATVYLRQRSSSWWPFQALRLNVTVLDPVRPDRLLSGGIDLSLAAWSSLSLFVLRFLDALFGPTLTLASTAVVVVGFGMQQILQRQDKEEEEGINQKLQEIGRLGELVKTDPGKAVRLWWEYSRWASPVEGKPAWQKPPLQEKLSAVWDRDIAEQPWREAVLTEAVGLFNNGDNEKAVIRARLIYNLDPQDKSVEAIAAGCLIACAEQKKHQVVNIAGQVGSSQVVAAIWQFYNRYADGELAAPVKSIIAQALAEMAGQAATVVEVEQFLFNEEKGLRLLREPEFGDVVQRLIAESSEPQQRQLAAKIQAKRGESYRWPELWPEWLQSLQAGETDELKWLREVISSSFEYNPFVPGKAELDPNFQGHFDYPPLLASKTGPQRAARPSILFGGPGSGKTGTALIVAYDCHHSREGPPGKGVFPLYLPLGLAGDQERDELFYLDLMARAAAENLVEFLALNPYTYLEHQENQSFALAHMLTYSTGSAQTVEIHLRQTELANSSAGRRLVKRMIEHSRVFPRRMRTNREDLLEMLRHARPAGFDRTYVLLDLSLVSETKTREAAQLQPLLDLMLPLARRKVYLKLFLPLSLKEGLMMPAGVIAEIQRWTPEALDHLLKKRLEAAQSRIESLDTFFDRDARDLNPTAMLIEAAGGSPSQLIKLIRQLIQYQLERNNFVKIDYNTLEKVL